MQQFPECLETPTGDHNRSLLWEAVRHGREELVSYLLDQGADVQGAGRNRSETMVLLSPLAVAELVGRSAIAERLRDFGAVLTLPDLAFLGRMDRIREDVIRFPERVNARVEEDVCWEVTALHYAAAGNQLEVVRFFLEHGGDVQVGSALLLACAARNGNGEMLDCFLNAGVSISLLTPFDVLVGGTCR